IVVRRGILLVLALVTGAAPVAAQTTPPAQSTAQPSGAEFLPRFDFHVSMEHLVSDEKRFVWDANFGADLDIVDYGGGRLRFVANYQTILGSEFREFDPNQGNYILEGSVSARAAALELAGVFHHESRHLSDRPKRDPVDWNMVGVRLQSGVRRGRTELRGRVDFRGVVERTLVDYRWEVDSDVAARVGLGPRVAVVATGGLRLLGVDGSRNRGTQYGYRGEGGLRIDGPGAALDLFVAAERRIDPYQLEFSTVTWLTTGFRVSSRAPSRVP
ncbi:MAG: hypothetical protein HW394_518, partial [Acidobacteria bacterium]|nr:hypothetical protein [Acidobacteriota bacterium]